MGSLRQRSRLKGVLQTSTSKMLSPAFKGIAGQKNSYIGEKPNPNGKPAALMIGPVLPFVQAKNNFKPSEISEDVPVRLGREMVGPIYQGKSNDPYNEFNEVAAKKPFEPPMVGPIYPGIDTTNQFNPKIEKIKGPVDRMAGPIYEGIEIHNQFNQVDERVRGDIVMVGPVYHGLETKHQYKAPSEKKTTDKPIMFPVPNVADINHKYQPPLEKVSGELARCAPVYHDLPPAGKYCPPVDKKETEKTFMGPIYTGIDAKNKYFPEKQKFGFGEEQPKLDAGLMGPKYPIPESTSNFCPDAENPKHEPIMVGPIYPNIETTNQYNPALTERVKGQLDMAGPVYGVETKNVYAPVPAREKGGDMLAGPVYHGVDTKNKYVPEKKGGFKELANEGPVRRNVDTDIKYTPEIAKKDGEELARCGPVYHGIDAGKSNKYCPKSERVPGELAPAYPVLSEQNLPTGMYCPTGLDGSKKVDNELPLEAPLYFNKHNKQLQSDC